MTEIDPSWAWSRPNVVTFYATQRSSRDALHPSEAHFLPRLLKPGLTVLDVGCAAGGFCRILRELEPDIRYTGVDLSGEMIAEARRRYPDQRFEIAPGEKLPFRDGSFDLVLCTGGTLPMILSWRSVLQECWRVSRARVLFDVRAVGEGEDLEDIKQSYIKLAFSDEWEERAVSPYVVITMGSLYKAVMSLTPTPREVLGFGYYHAVSDMAVTRYREVCMTTLCVGKDPTEGQPVLEWDVPLPWPGLQNGQAERGQGYHL